MDILIINGSRKNGNTCQLAWELADTIQASSPGQRRILELSTMDMGFCLSCHQCFSRNEGVCPDAEPCRIILSAIEEADLIMIASPVYAMQVSGLVKNWLDHFAFVIHRPRFFRKRAVIVTTTAGAGTGNVLRYLKQVLPMWGMTTVYTLQATLFGERYQSDPKLKNTIARLGARIISEHNGKQFHRPSLYHLSMHTAFRVLNHLYAPDHVERMYWERTGLTDPVYPGPSHLAP